MGVEETLGVDPSEVSAWVAAGANLEDVSEMCRQLCHYLREGRSATVARRRASRLGGRSLLEVLAEGRSAEALAAVKEMFAFGRVGEPQEVTMDDDRGREWLSEAQLARIGVWHTALVMPVEEASNVMRPLTGPELSQVADIVQAEARRRSGSGNDELRRRLREFTERARDRSDLSEVTRLLEEVRVSLDETDRLIEERKRRLGMR